jgi:antitoxin component HigA of HigAB toxin-antitoxin module
MATKVTTTKVTDTYFKLVRQHPLRPIRNATDLASALATIDRLLQEDLDHGGKDYLAVLSSLVGDYEDEHVEIPDASEAEALRELMRAGGLSQAKLATKVGIVQSTLSDLANGRRGFTTEHIAILSKYFGVSPAVFFRAV